MSDPPVARTGLVRCAACHATVAAELDDVTVVTVGDLRVAFRRHTDHVVCPRCLVSNRVDDLRTLSRSA
jgi:hypothetical protein